MNRQNFEAADRFPLSTQALTFMQEMIFATAKLALIGGDNYILSGCTTSGNTVSDGVIVIAGEPMPFKGGTSTATITIVEETIPVSANGLTFDKARTKRHAKFATGTGANYLPWADFKPLATNKQLEEAKATVKYVDDAIAGIQSGGIPQGVVVMWSGSPDLIPPGWALCNGDTVNGFATPNLRNRFVVGYNRDDNDYANIGNTGGVAAVKLTVDHMPAHTHLGGSTTRDPARAYKYGYEKNADGGVEIMRAKWEWDVYNGYTSTVGKDANNINSLENRPPYYVLAFIVKL